MLDLPNPPPPPGDAFVGALTESQTALRGYCEAALGHGDDAKDAWQRTNLVLWKKAADWQPGSKFLPWALAVARYEVLAGIRDRQRERILFDSDVVELMADATADQAELFTDRRDALQLCLQNLPARQREILAAHYVSGHSLSDIANHQNMGLSAVKVLLMRVRRALGICISKHLLQEAQS